MCHAFTATYVEFCLLLQACTRLRYGHWMEPRFIRPDIQVLHELHRVTEGESKECEVDKQERGELSTTIGPKHGKLLYNFEV